jgi:hypothetical protein
MEFGRVLSKDISDQGYGSRFNRVAMMFTLRSLMNNYSIEEAIIALVVITHTPFGDQRTVRVSLCLFSRRWQYLLAVLQQ